MERTHPRSRFCSWSKGVASGLVLGAVLRSPFTRMQECVSSDPATVVASWLDIPLADVRDGRSGVPPGSYLWGTDAAMEDLLVIQGGGRRRPGALRAGGPPQRRLDAQR
jgi:hypothetical protein